MAVDGEHERIEAIGEAMQAQQAAIIDTAKMFFLIGAQAMEISMDVKRDIDLEKAWTLMMTTEDVENIKRNRALFLQSIFKD